MALLLLSTVVSECRAEDWSLGPVTDDDDTIAVISAVLCVPLSLMNAKRLMASSPSVATGVLGSAAGAWAIGLGVKMAGESDGKSENVGSGIMLTIGVTTLVLGVANIVGGVRSSGENEQVRHVRYSVTPRSSGLALQASIKF